jgi:hypothetical protein
VPDDPFDYAVADTDPYFMPIGIGMNPATPVNRIVSPLDQLGQVRRLTGNVMFFDADDKLQYVPWMQDLGASTPARTFQAYDGRDLDGGLLGTSALALTTSVRNVINQLLLVGIDAYDSWVPIVEKREDADSIWAAPGSQGVNYVGFRAPGVQMDPRFADRGFSRRSADLMFAWLRQPEVTVPVSPGWPQFDLFPLAQIRVRDWHTRLEELPLFIMSISNRVSRAGANWQFGCSIQSRYLDPELLGIAAADLATFDRDDTDGFDSDDGSWSFDQA